MNNKTGAPPCKLASGCVYTLGHQTHCWTFLNSSCSGTNPQIISLKTVKAIRMRPSKSQQPNRPKEKKRRCWERPLNCDRCLSSRLLNMPRKGKDQRFTPKISWDIFAITGWFLPAAICNRWFKEYNVHFRAKLAPLHWFCKLTQETRQASKANKSTPPWTQSNSNKYSEISHPMHSSQHSFRIFKMKVYLRSSCSASTLQPLSNWPVYI